MVLGLEPRVLCVGGKHSITLLHSQSCTLLQIFLFLPLDMHFRTKQVYSKGEDVAE